MILESNLYISIKVLMCHYVYVFLAVVHPLPSKPILSVCGKNRTRFSPTMVQFMEKHYQENKYPKADDYKLMASVLGLDWNKIKVLITLIVYIG